MNKNTKQSDYDTYTQSQYKKMEIELEEEINKLIESTEIKYNIQPIVKADSLGARVKIFIPNKAIHNNPPIY